MNDEFNGDVIICSECYEVNDISSTLCKSCNAPLDDYSSTLTIDEMQNNEDYELKDTEPVRTSDLIAPWFFFGWIFPVYLLVVTANLFGWFEDLETGLILLIPISIMTVYCSVLIREVYSEYREHEKGNYEAAKPKSLNSCKAVNL